MSRIYGYARVSTEEQNIDRQMRAFFEKKIPRERIFLDRQSGKDFNRPEYANLLKLLQKDDLLYIGSIDRLGRSYSEIQKQWYILTKEIGIDICVLDMPLLDTRKGKDLMENFIADLTLQILSFVAEAERLHIHKRQQEGISAAKARGVRFGRPPKALPPDFIQILADFDAKKISLNAALQQSGISRSGFYGKLKEYRIGQKLGK